MIPTARDRVFGDPYPPKPTTPAAGPIILRITLAKTKTFKLTLLDRDKR